MIHAHTLLLCAISYDLGPPLDDNTRLYYHIKNKAFRGSKIQDHINFVVCVIVL